MKTYIVEIQTSNEPSAGTDAAVYIQFIHGEESDEKRSNPLRLNNRGKDDFAIGHTDFFTVLADDIGWIDRIRLFHDNSSEGPGWFVNYVKVTDAQTGLEWKVPLYRWLAVNKGDGQIDVTCDVPVEVTLGDGILQTFYVGYQMNHYDNQASEALKISGSFQSSYKSGISLEESSTTSVKTGLQVGYDFFVKSNFTVEVTHAIGSKNGSTEEETLEHKNDYEFTIPPGQSITVVALYFQDVLRGKLTAHGISAEYEQKFDVRCDITTFDGVLSEPEALAGIRQKIEDHTGTNVPLLTSEEERIPLAQVSVPQVDKASLEVARGNLPQHIV